MIAGIDPSLSDTAVVIGDGVDYEVRTFQSKPIGQSANQRCERYELLTADVCGWIERVGELEAIYLEGYSFASNFNNNAIVEYGAILRWSLWGVGNRIIEVAPGTLKKFCTGKGSSPKNIVAAHLTKRYGVLLDSDDEYDAYGLYRLGLVAEGLVEPETQWQREAAAVAANGKAKKVRSRK